METPYIVAVLIIALLAFIAYRAFSRRNTAGGGSSGGRIDDGKRNEESSR